MNAMDKEMIRQQRETFEQSNRQNRQWFALRLTIGYSAVFLLLGVLAVCATVLLQPGRYPDFVVNVASGTLLVDVLGSITSVWKFALATPR